MTVQSVCLGWHWQPYAYSRTADDTDGAPVKPLPADVRRARPAGRRRHDFGADVRACAYEPDAAIVNLYAPGARLGLHQDGEEPSDAPVVTISLGDTCTFRMAGVDRRTAPFTDVELRSGDLLVFGGPSRRIFHGVPKVRNGTAPDGLGLPPGASEPHASRDRPRMTRRLVPGGPRPRRVGVAPIGRVLDPDACRELVGLYDDDARFRSTVDMARHRFGEGEYRYFAHPLPEVVADLRRSVLAAPAPDRPCVGGRGATSRSRGPTTSTTGSSGATPPARPARRRSCSATGPATGTRCTATSTATSSSRSRW